MPAREQVGEAAGMSFSALDAARPFLTANEGLSSEFGPELSKRLDSLHDGDAFRSRLRSCLMEVLASGGTSMGAVASRLTVSTRTLQRRLREEDTSFQAEQNQLREELAGHYLSNSWYSSVETSFLLGHDDPNSVHPRLPRMDRPDAGEHPRRRAIKLIRSMIFSGAGHRSGNELREVEGPGYAEYRAGRARDDRAASGGDPITHTRVINGCSP